MTRFQFVADHRDAFEVKRMCQVLETSRGSFYAWLDGADGRAQRAADDAALAAQITALQDPSQGGDRAYGAPRITADLNAARGPRERINHKRVARVMRVHGLAGIRLRRRVRPAAAEPSGRKFPDLIKRDFSAGAPGCRYVGDITYLPIAGGSNLYLATVIDLFSRKLVGWALADHMRTELVENALNAARAERGSLRGAVFHSDHGSVGGFNRSSQHLDHGGVQRWQQQTGAGRPATRPRVFGGSGVLTGRYGQRCARPAGPIHPGRYSGSSGG